MAGRGEPSKGKATAPSGRTFYSSPDAQRFGEELEKQIGSMLETQDYIRNDADRQRLDEMERRNERRHGEVLEALNKVANSLVNLPTLMAVQLAAQLGNQPPPTDPSKVPLPSSRETTKSPSLPPEPPSEPRVQQQQPFPQQGTRYTPAS
jgi:hypothetical protein